MAGSTIFKAQTKSPAGSTWPRGNVIWGKVHLEAFNEALAVMIAELWFVNGNFASITSTCTDGKDDTFTWSIASKMLMPLMANDLSGINREGGSVTKRVKHVSRRDDANERGGQGLQKWSALLDLYKFALHGTQLVDNWFGIVPAKQGLQHACYKITKTTWW